MTKELTESNGSKHEVELANSLTREQIELIKTTVARGATDDELKLFLYTAKKTGLDPLLKQIIAVKRWDSGLQKEVMTIQTGIDGYRLIAERTENYMPGRTPEFEERNGKLYAATAFIKKYSHGEWHEISATAYYDEYVQTKKDGTPTKFWRAMPRNQLAKCAEALAIRKSFPVETSGVYTSEEMENSLTYDGSEDQVADKTPPASPPKEKKAAPQKSPAPKGETAAPASNDPIWAVITPSKTKETVTSDRAPIWWTTDERQNKYYTFSKTAGGVLTNAEKEKASITIQYKITRYGNQILTAEIPREEDMQGDVNEPEQVDDPELI